MDFDKNQESFDTCVHQRIWEFGIQFLPLKLTLPHVPEELKEACTQFHTCVTSLYADMYQHPEAYGLTVDETLEEWQNKGRAALFFDYLGWILRYGDNQFTMPAAEYKKVEKRVTVPRLIEGLSRHGWLVERSGGTVTVSNTLYPRATECVLAMEAADRANNKLNCGHALRACDFRVLSGYKRTYEDLWRVLSDQNLAVAKTVHERMAAHGAKPQQCDYFYRVEYKRKSKRFAQADFCRDWFRPWKYIINIEFARGLDLQSIEAEVNAAPNAAELRQFILSNLNFCKRCKPTCGNDSFNPRLFLGEMISTCGQDLRIGKLNPAEADIPYFLQVIDIAIR